MPAWRYKVLRPAQGSGRCPDGYRSWAAFYDSVVYPEYYCLICGDSARTHFWLPEPDGRNLFERGYGGGGMITCDRFAPGQIPTGARIARMVRRNA